MIGERVGLTLGKFAPLHRGHQHVIETALAETSRLIVLIYDCPAVIDVPLAVRAAWIRRLYPQVDVIEAVDGPQMVGSDPEITRAHDAYILRVLAGRRVTRFYSSEFYGAHVSLALGAEDRRVDPDRERFPVSGTAVRQAPFEHRHWLAPGVYRDLVKTSSFSARRRPGRPRSVDAWRAGTARSGCRSTAVSTGRRASATGGSTPRSWSRLPKGISNARSNCCSTPTAISSPIPTR